MQLLKANTHVLLWMRSIRAWMGSIRAWMTPIRAWMRSIRAWMRSIRAWMRSIWVWMRSFRAWMSLSERWWDLSDRGWVESERDEISPSTDEIYPSVDEIYPIVMRLCGFKDIYGCIYDWVTLFTWYGHKNLVDTVLTAAVSDLALWTLRNPETARFFECLILQVKGSLGLPRNKRTVVPLFTFYLKL